MIQIQVVRRLKQKLVQYFPSKWKEFEMLATIVCIVYHTIAVNNTNFNPFALRKAKIVYNFGLSECTRVN